MEQALQEIGLTRQRSHPLIEQPLDEVAQSDDQSKYIDPYTHLKVSNTC